MNPEYEVIYPGYVDPNSRRMPEYPDNRVSRQYPRVPSQGNIRQMYPYPRRMAMPRNGYGIPTRSHYPPMYDPRMTHQGAQTGQYRPVGFNPQMEFEMGNHLDEGLAMHVMSKLYYTDRHGEPHNEPKWSIDEIEQATEGWEFHLHVTPFDKWVAFNFFYADTCKVLSPKEAIKVGYYFFFHDEDAPTDKVFRYLEGMGILDD